MLVAALLACFAVLPMSAFGALPPHVAADENTDSCAMCHRAHTAASNVEFPEASGGKSNALVVGNHPATSGDTQLCYSCHGAEGVGAESIVQDEFDAGSGHKIAPDTSAYGPALKQCSDCHDSHGSAKQTGGAPYPGLLRALDDGGTPVYGTDDYCAACHPNRPIDRWDGGDVWQQTAHASLSTPSQSGIVCSVCHEPHGSPYAPAIVSKLTTPAVSVETTVTGNNRTLCLGCHEAASVTWPGKAIFDASAHGSSDTSVAARGEWAASGFMRKVGECQNCHAPMGSADVSGNLVPKLLEAEGRAECDRCHDGDGPAAADMKSTAFSPGGVISEVVVAYGADADNQNWGSLDVFTRETTASSTLFGPRRFVNGALRDVTAGDIDGDGGREVVAVSSDSATVTVLSSSSLYGLAADPGETRLPVPPSTPAPADFIGIADVLDDVANLPELVTARRTDPLVRVYRWNGTGFAPVDTVDAGDPVTGLALGDVTGSSTGDVVVTLDTTPGAFGVMSGGSSLTTSAPVSARAGATNPTLYDVDSDGKAEIVLSNPDDASVNVSVVEANGTELAQAGTEATLKARAARVGDILPGEAAEELIIGYSTSGGTSEVHTYPRSGSGFGAAIVTTLPVNSMPSDLDVGDTDGDGVPEAVVGLSGTFSRTGNGSGPGLAILHAASGGSTIAPPQLRFGGGVEAAGSSAVLVTDIGAIGPSRHPVGAGSGSHISTETVTVSAHVECVDCHNVHEASNTTETAPAVPGSMSGVPGVGVVPQSSSSFTLVEKGRVDNEYEVCLKCHSTWSALDSSRSIASEVSTLNASFHPIEGPAQPTNAIGTLTGGYSAGSQIYCTDCHGSVGSGPKGPHASPAAPLLSGGYVGRPAATDVLCFDCHKQGVYAPTAEVPAIDGTSGVQSGFWDASTTSPLHKMHADDGFSCDSCHVTHGSPTEKYLLRGDIGWNTSSGGGSCSTACHSATHSYQR